MSKNDIIRYLEPLGYSLEINMEKGLAIVIKGNEIILEVPGKYFHNGNYEKMCSDLFNIIKEKLNI